MPTEAPAVAPQTTGAPSSPPPLTDQSVQPTPSAAPVAAKVTPGSKAWAEMSQEQRYEQLRGPPNPRATGYSPKRDQMEQVAARAAGEPAPSATSAEPAALNAEKVKIGKYEVSEADLATMMGRQAQDDLRKATLPPTPNDYKLELSPNATLPGGVEYKFDASNPGLAALRNWAHAKGFDQSTLSEILTIYATHEAQQNAALAEISRAEVAKVGVNGPQRVDAIGRWIRGEVGDADAKPILATMVTDAHVRFYEKLLQRITSQGAAPFSQAHRTAPDDSKIPGFETMSFAQQRQAQDQISQRRR
jgi:hypothetical protein